MAKNKWGQTCENSASVATCLWCNTGVAGSGSQDHVPSGQSSGSGADIAEGTTLGTGAAVGDVLVMKTKPVTASGTSRFAVVDTTARDFIIHSQSSDQSATT